MGFTSHFSEINLRLLCLVGQVSYEVKISYSVTPHLKLHPTKTKELVLIIRNDLQMTKGKVAAQCCHATLQNYQSANTKSTLKINNLHRKWLNEWEKNGQAKITLKVESENEMMELQSKARGMGLLAKSVIDAGRTQIASGSRTVLAIGSAPVELINQVSGHLKLY